MVTGNGWDQNHLKIARIISQPDQDVFVGDSEMTITLQPLTECKRHDLAANNVGNGKAATLGCGATTKIIRAQ